MKQTLFTGVCVTLLLTVQMAQAQHHHHHIGGNTEHTSNAPIGVMGDHLMHKGDWMVSYRTMLMRMNGLRDGTNSLSANEVLTNSPNSPTDFTVTPTQMTSEMHMLGGMYGLSDDVTLMVMGSYNIRQMDHVTDAATTFRTRSEGIGDVRAAGLIKLYEDDTHHVHLNAGVSLPTGSVDETDQTPANPNTMLPFKMQLGSGTFDLMPGIAYTGQAERIGWGSQYQGTLRLGRNSQDYSLGDIHQLSGWGSYRWADWISTSLRLTGQLESQVDGNNLNPGNPTFIPTTDPDNYGGEKLDLGIGVNLAGQGNWTGHRLGFEISAPIYQDLNGPQLQGEYMASFGYQFSW